MSDPIEKLNRLGDALEGAPMPLPASEIRARGDRIRRRRHAVIAGASAAVVAAVAVPVIAITGGGSDKGDQPFTPDPTITDSVPMPSLALSEANLLTSKDAIYPNGGGDWQESETFPDDGQAPVSPCQQGSFDDLGANSVFHRTFEFFVADINAVDFSNLFNEVVAEFPSEASAQSAYETVQGWYAACQPLGSTGFTPGQVTEVPIGVDGTAERQLLLSRGSGADGNILDAGFVLSGNRVALLAQEIPGQDYNWPEGGSPVELMLPVAAERLVEGGGTVPDEPPTAVETDWPTSIPASFPLTSGWPEDDGSSEYQLDAPSADNQAMIPAGELRACVFDAVDAGAVARLTARLSYGSDNYVRELQLLPTDQEAVTYLAQLRALYEGCPTEDQNGAPPTFTTEVTSGSVGEGSLVITRASDGIGRVVINAVRVGNAVVVDLASDEGEGDTVIDLATETRENLSDVVGRLYELAAPADPGSDLTDPAGTTAIPADFPLDLALGEPPAEDSETTISGPEADVDGVRPQTACGSSLSMPGSSDPQDQLGYSISSIGGYDGRTIETHATVQDAIDRMDQLRAELQGCDRDNEGDGLSDRLWESFNSNTGYDSMTFGWTYEATEFQGPTAGQLYSVVRVGNAILAIEWGSEGSAQSQVDSAPNQVELAQLIAAEMCVFAEAGC